MPLGLKKEDKNKMTKRVQDIHEDKNKIMPR